MADNHFATLVSKDSAVNAVANPIYTSISDGTDTLAIDASGNIAVTDGGLSLTVDGTVAVSSVGGTVTVSATDLDIRDLTHVSDSVKVGDGTDFLAIDASGNIGVTDAGGSLTVDGTVAVSSVAGTVTVAATDLDIRDLTHVSDSVKIGDGTDFLAIDASGNIGVTDAGGSLTVDGSVTVTATDLDIRNLNLTDDAVKVSANTTANGPANPIYVALGSGPITGEVHSYDTSTVAGNTADNHDYTVATAMLVKSIIVSSSGALKAELQTGPVASLVTKAVLFIPKVGGSHQVNFDPPIEVPVTSTGTVRIIRTNREGSSNDVYSTIIGIDA